MFTVIQMLAHENKTHTTNVSVSIKKTIHYNDANFHTSIRS